MRLPANQLFAALLGLYALQSGLLSLRWGYQMAGLGIWIALIAPLLPILAYLAFDSLNNALIRKHLWHGLPILFAWGVFAIDPDRLDSVIISIYFSYGTALILAARRNPDFALTRLSEAFDTRRAMMITGAALIASALIDIFIIIDFIRSGGANISFALSLIQAAVLVLLGYAATHVGGLSAHTQRAEAANPEATETDADIITAIQTLFERDGLHRDMDLNLRRLARKLGQPDRAVSNAINRTQGISVSQLVNRRRIADACALLTTTDQSILQISLAAGFLSKSNFNREFTRITGKTPSEYRRGKT